jgi:protein involved in polysaccharide export with SLBB domain
MKPHVAIAVLAAVVAAFTLSAGAQDPAVSPAKFEVSVQGQVVKPGKYSVTPDLTVIDAIELAGGFTERALRSSVKIGHKDAAGAATTTTLDYSDFALNNNNAKFQLQAGDIIFVPPDPSYGK